MAVRWLCAVVMFLGLAACHERSSPVPSNADRGEPTVAKREPTTVASGSDGMPVPPLIDLKRPTEPALSIGRTDCHGITGFLYDPDPVGRIVRDAPSAKARQLGRIPPPAPSEDFAKGWPYEFMITGSEGGWLHISHVTFDETMGGKPPKPPFAGTGWIAAGGVYVGVQSRTGFAAPSHSAPVLISTYPDADLDSAGPQRIVACQGRWILADWPATNPKDDGGPPWRPHYRAEAVVSRNPVTVRAWVAGVCNNIETTCDGISGDYPETSGLEDGSD